jgi:hypothetical protein
MPMKDAAPCVDILQDDVLEQFRFAHAGLSDHQHMVHAIELTNPPYKYVSVADQAA